MPSPVKNPHDIEDEFDGVRDLVAHKTISLNFKVCCTRFSLAFGKHNHIQQIGNGMDTLRHIFGSVLAYLRNIGDNQRTPATFTIHCPSQQFKHA